MKTFFIFFCLTIFSQLIFSQKDFFEPWDSTVIQLNGLSIRPSVHLEINQLFNDYEKGLITEPEVYKQHDYLRKKSLSETGNVGTGILVKYRGEYFIVTNRHVIVDKEKFEYLKVADSTNRSFIEFPLYERILFVPRYKEYQEHYSPSFFLTKSGLMLDAGNETNGFTVSRKEDDLAVISLSNKRFTVNGYAGEFIYRGYKPIMIDGRFKEAKVGDRVFSIGFPVKISTQANVYDRDTITSPFYNSKLISQPNISRGKVIDVDDVKNKITAELLIFPGNSGSPVFNQAGDFFGVVSAVYKRKGEKGYWHEGQEFTLPYATIIPARLVEELLRIQFEKDIKFQKSIKD